MVGFGEWRRTASRPLPPASDMVTDRGVCPCPAPATDSGGVSGAMADGGRLPRRSDVDARFCVCKLSG